MNAGTPHGITLLSRLSPCKTERRMMSDTTVLRESKSTADVVFDRLQDDILTLRLLPGSKMSEADIARHYGVSRQPVRDAFRRLHALNLLDIRPQRATVVRRFSLDQIAHTRFVRLAVELEVIDRACACWNSARADALAINLADQELALDADNVERFHDLDYGFHEAICRLSGLPMAFETISRCKRAVDRLCVLSLTDHEDVAEVLGDHRAIADALFRRDAAAARARTRTHVGRLDKTISDIHKTHAEYFD